MRQVAVLGIALVASLALAWTVYTDDTVERDEDAVALYADPGDSLRAISWSDEEGEVTLERKSDSKGEYLWVTVVEEIEVAPVQPEPPVDGDSDADSDVGVDGDSDATADADTDAPAPAITERITRTFRGNAQASDVFEKFSPLYALRDLTEGASTAAFGLDTPKATLTITTSSGVTALQVGGETFGAKDRYVANDNRVFLVDDGDLRPLQYAKTRLVERALVPFTPPEITRIEVDSSGRRAVWLHQNRDDRGADYWALESSPDAGEEAAKSWMRKLLAVRAQAYVDETELDTTLEPVLAYTVTGEDTSFKVTILREATESDDPRWFARSEYTRSLTELTRSLATDAFVDVDAVLP